MSREYCNYLTKLLTPWANFLVLCFVLGCTHTPGAETSDNRVYWSGAQKNVVRFGNFTDTVSISELSQKKSLYGIGPVSRLQGEITVVDGDCFVSDVIQDKEVVAKDCSKKAPFFVYGYFSTFQNLKISPTFNKLEMFANEFESWVIKAGLDVEKPVFFDMKVKAKSLKYHIIKKMGTSPHNPEEHNLSKRHFELVDQNVRIIGVFSKHHEGVFTHHGNKLHIHFVSEDQKHSGHVEDFDLAIDDTASLKISGGR
jgi:acetolactate decarboxylase